MQRLALLPHSKNVVGWVPWPGGSLRQCLRRFSRFLPQCRDVHVMADLASPGNGWVDTWLKIPANTFIFFHLWWVCSVLCCQTWEGVTSITQAVDSEPANVVFHFVRLSEITPRPWQQGETSERVYCWPSYTSATKLIDLFIYFPLAAWKPFS